MFTFSKMTRTLKLVAIPFMLATLAACATTFNADVSRFASNLPAPHGQTFAVVPDDPSLAGGIEFGQYASDVAKHLEKYGYTKADSAKDAQLLVHFDYGVDNGHTVVRGMGGFGYDPYFSPWYGWGFGYDWDDFDGIAYRHHYHPHYRQFRYLPDRDWGWGWYNPFFAQGPYVDSYVVYTSGISLKIDDAQTGKRLFEGRAKAVSTSNNLQYLVPNLIQAMFTGFPGNSGETVRISIAPQNKAAKNDNGTT